MDFFADHDDQLVLLDFFLAETDVRVFEHSGRPDSDLREFRSSSEVDEAFHLGLDPHGNGLNATLALWSPSVMPHLSLRKITFDPNRVTNATFRMEPEGGALMQLYLGGVNGRVITKSHFGHNSEARARKWGVGAGVRWSVLRQLSRRIQYQLGRRMAVARVPGRPIHAGAAALWREGYALKESVGTPYHWQASGLIADA